MIGLSTTKSSTYGILGSLVSLKGISTTISKIRIPKIEYGIQVKTKGISITISDAGSVIKQKKVLSL